MALQAILRRYVPNTIDVAAVLAQSQALLADLSSLKAADGALDRSWACLAMRGKFVYPEPTTRQKGGHLEGPVREFVVVALC